ncbi:hypothetical protein BJY24_006583 [Nocardia transvalensis]|uniref:Uncharacterized protein n=1 Tax=Nocardia transvalensis TaxID=37333 RepID=A0A7W9ULK9_9NOCA|nr:hypothetical protein [Nocardia transvalensis]MBB5917671.1 hypothetical protein [Nocardia transvalensis]
MWLYALWGFLGAAFFCGVEFLEAGQRVGGWPWKRPAGPGGGPYAVAIVVRLALGAGVTAALAAGGVLTNVLVAVGAGAAAPAILKSLAALAERMPIRLPAGSRGGSA